MPEIGPLGLRRRGLETDLRFDFQGTHLRPSEICALRGGLVLDGNELVAELFGLPLEFCF